MEDAESEQPQLPLDELLGAAGQLLASGNLLPGLILLYSAIDIVASLNRPEDKPAATRDDFLRWVDTYLLPGSGLACTAIDLYAARCGLLHTYTPESLLTDQGKARQIEYDRWGSDSLQQLLSLEGLHRRTAAVPVEKLFNAFLDGTEKWEFDLASDPVRQALLDRRVTKFYRTVDIGHIESRIALFKHMKAKPVDVHSLSDFIAASATRETLLIKVRNDDNELFYLLLAPSCTSDSTVSLSVSVEDEMLHAEETIQTIQTRLKAAAHEYRYIDMDK